MVMQNKELRPGTQGFQRSIEYRNTHYLELFEKYPDHYIAIYDGELVGASTNLSELFDDLKAQSIPLLSTLLDKMETEDVNWVFPS